MAAAIELGLTRSERVEDVLRVGAELGVVVAFGRLIKAPVLDALPMVNLHFSLLPRWRGAAPVERAILAGDTETGVCLMKLDQGLDTGPVYDCARVDIGPEETAAELRDRLARAGCDLLLERLRNGLGEPAPQHGEATYAAKVEPAAYHLEWGRPAVELHRVVRLGRAWTTFRGLRLKVLRARLADCAPGAEPGTLDGVVVATAAGGLELVEVQIEGRSAQPAEAWRRGARPQPGERLGSEE
jgi:methionyl-tRNA formyltransferase